MTVITQTDKKTLKQTDFDHEIVLYNDDVNTFDHVIDMLVKYCKHSAVQAEQCAYLVHYNGKCSVRKGNVTELAEVCRALQNGGLSAELN